MFENCCEPFLKKVEIPQTAEQLMRSRYSAYVTQNADYLVETTHPSTRKFHKKEDILQWSKSNNWVRLEILKTSENIIEFKAYYIDGELLAQIHHEKSTFKRSDGKWTYVDGKFY